MVHRSAHCSGFSRWAGRALVLTMLTGSSLAAEIKPITLPRFPYPEPLPALVAAAVREGITINAHEWSAGPRPPATGDSVTFLVSLREGRELKQWVLVAEMADLNEQEAKLPPLAGYHRHSATGTEVKFAGRRAAIKLALLGPVTQVQADRGPVSPEVKRRRLLVNAEYLGLGLNSACEAILALRVENAKRAPGDRFDTKLGRKPFPLEVTKANRALADEVGFTLERERGFFGSVPALMEFLNLIVKTPGLQDILKEVMDVSWWSLLASAGKTNIRLQYLPANVEKLDSFGGGLAQHAFPFALMLNEKPAMACVLVVTDPVAPVGTTAGVIGIQAGRPYAPEPQLTVRLVGSRSPAAVMPRAAADPAGNSRK